MNRAARARWIMSFADLCLLLLGFFVLLQASQVNRDAALSGLGTYFGAIQAPRQVDLRAAALFEPGEALLTTRGRATLLRAAGPLTQSGAILRIQSIGLDPGERRFDSWDLAAARLGAVARALDDAGIPAAHLRIAGLAERADAQTPAGQFIRLIESPPDRP